jgi:nucleoside-diphosphate-sugar epimerase
MNPNKIINEDLERIVSSDIDWTKFENKNVLITGANGFLPAYMVETLLYLMHANIIKQVKVIALVRNSEKATKRFAHLLQNKHLQFLVQDVCSLIQIDEPIHYIIHAASQASPKYYGIDPIGTLRANVFGTGHLLQLAREKGVEKFLYFSSSEIYGQLSADKIPTKESDYGVIDPINIRSCYAESKRMGENMCISWSHQYQIPVNIVRPFHTYGPGMSLDDGRVYADFISDIVHSRDIVMKSDGSAIRAFCYIADAAIAFFTVLLKGENKNAYNVGNPDCEYTILELAKKIVNLFPAKKLSVITQTKREDVGYINSVVSKIAPDIKKIQHLGWAPIISVEEGFYRTIKSYDY